MSTGDDIPDRRERCECGAWDEDHEYGCRWDRIPISQCKTGSHFPHGLEGSIPQLFCPDGSGEFRRAVRPSYDD